MASAAPPGLAQDPLFGEAYRASSVLHSLGEGLATEQRLASIRPRDVNGLRTTKLRLSDTPIGGDPANYERKGQEIFFSAKFTKLEKI
jgi:hypothetical protein